MTTRSPRRPPRSPTRSPSRPRRTTPTAETSPSRPRPATMESGADAPSLNVVGFGPLVDGAGDLPNTPAPPAVVKVTSSAGGSDSSTLIDVRAPASPRSLRWPSSSCRPPCRPATPWRWTAGPPSVTSPSYAWCDHDGTVTPDPTTPGLATWTPELANAAATITLNVTGPGGERIGDQHRERDAADRRPRQRGARPGQDPRSGRHSRRYGDRAALGAVEPGQRTSGHAVERHVAESDVHLPEDGAPGRSGRTRQRRVRRAQRADRAPARPRPR